MSIIFTITLSDEEVKALATDIISIELWLSNASHAKAISVMNRIVEANTDKRADALSLAEKSEIIRGLVLETALERQKRIEQELSNE